MLDGKSPEDFGVPSWRARVTYVPQSRVHPKGTPSELYYTAQVRPCTHVLLATSSLRGSEGERLALRAEVRGAEGPAERRLAGFGARPGPGATGIESALGRAIGAFRPQHSSLFTTGDLQSNV